MDRMAAMNARRYGFAWGQVYVTRLAEVKRRATDSEPYRVLSVNDLTIYVSPTGRTRVFKKHKELKEAPDATARERHRGDHQATGEGQPDRAG